MSGVEVGRRAPEKLTLLCTPEVDGVKRSPDDDMDDVDDDEDVGLVDDADRNAGDDNDENNDDVEVEIVILRLVVGDGCKDKEVEVEL